MIVENIKYNKYPNDIHKMTGPTVFTSAIQSVHEELYGENIITQLLRYNTNISYKRNNVFYRVFGIDFNNHFSFSYNGSSMLYHTNKKWTQEQKEKNLLK